VITQSKWMPGIITIFSLASFGKSQIVLSFWYSLGRTLSTKMPGSSFFSSETTARARVIARKGKLTHPYFLLTAAVTDILITSSLIYSLVTFLCWLEATCTLSYLWFSLVDGLLISRLMLYCGRLCDWLYRPARLLRSLLLLMPSLSMYHQ
jgi:hypothetical protein